MSKEVFDPWGEGSGYYADQVEVGDYETHSKLLGPDGNPLKYVERQKVGFNLSKVK